MHESTRVRVHLMASLRPVVLFNDVADSTTFVERLRALDVNAS